jgi:phosphoglycolate phosphatase
MIRGILFDKDGTLVDFDRTWGPAAYAVMRILAGEDAAALDRLVDVSHYILEERRFLRSSPLVAGSADVYGRDWATALGRTDPEALAVEIDKLFAIHGLANLAPIGEPLAVLEVLSAAGFKLGIATNDAEVSAVTQAETMGLIPHLDFVAGYDSGHGAKPSPGMILGFARACGLEPAEVAMVGDSTHDLDSARAAGAVAIAVLSGPAPREELEPHADHVVDSIADLPELLAGLR